MRSKEANTHIRRSQCIQHESVFVAAITIKITADGRSTVNRSGTRRLDENVGAYSIARPGYFSNDDMAIGGYFFCLSHRIKIPGPSNIALLGYSGLEAERPDGSVR